MESPDSQSQLDAWRKKHEYYLELKKENDSIVHRANEILGEEAGLSWVSNEALKRTEILASHFGADNINRYVGGHIVLRSSLPEAEWFRKYDDNGEDIKEF